MSQSLTSKITNFILELVNSKKVFLNKENALEYMNKKAIENKKTYKPAFPFSLKLKNFCFMDMQTFLLEGTCNEVILYIPGGAFVANPHILQWNFIFEIHKQTNCHIVVPIYPKAPTYTYKDTYEKLLPLYQKIAKHKPDKITIMGDSAGGNIALSLALQIKKKKFKKPNNVVLFSPCLDLTMSEKDIEIYEKLDPMLAPKGLFEMYKAWAGKTKLSLPILSPINGNFDGIGQISLFVGTHEILLPEARTFLNKATQQNIKINYFEGEGLNHVYPAHPIPEAKVAMKQIVNILKGEST